jgi:hypothetical protein
MGSNYRNFVVIFMALFVVITFQNCSKVAFSGATKSDLSVGPDSTSVPDGAATPPPGTDTGTPTASATPPCTTTTTDYVLCYLADGNGDSDRIGQDSTVLDVSTAVPQDVCMSSNACLVLINNYLNHTAGNINGQYGAITETLAQYTAVKDNGVCGHNPNVSILSDAQIASDLADMAAAHK